MSAKRTMAALGVTAFLGSATVIGEPLTLHHEGMKLAPYYDSVGIKTWCVGETEIGFKDTFTSEECISLFGIRYGYYSRRVAEFYSEKGRETVTPEMHAAFTDMAYNVGIGTVKNSGMIRRVNAGNAVGACAKILEYRKAGRFKDCSLTKGMKDGCYGVWDRRLRVHGLCMSGV